MSRASILVSGGIIVTLLCVVMLVVSLRQNKFRLLNGVLCNMAILTSGVTLVIGIEQLGNTSLNFLLLMLLLLFFGLLALLYLFQGVFLLWNALIVWRKESHTLSNMLTLFLAIIIIVVLPLLQVLSHNLFPHASVTLYNILIVPIIAYLGFWFLSFITSFLITRLYRPRYNQEYIIVLGAGLLNGDQVSPLLASRIIRALTFATKQEKRLVSILC
ncbi:hypothetical protein [Ligilactobacillus acidipiscis]|uniref:hypothetical protein n=1 Tax=Ligilactobacillus acidipiscis TaxID=89059 RepID=UPI0023FA0309|nr:hypothetical protein [Ligilactobacillus acidipiscis]WEV56820.1 hypothetical protein OZX66_11425 [Ligilactobacillus acidipiscis]